jgi:hypothetical protein
MPGQNRAIFTDPQLLDGLERHGWNATGFKAFAAEVCCSVGLVRIRERRIRIARGETARSHDLSWESKLRYRPTLEQVERLERTHGDYACLVRWGAVPAELKRLAKARKP